MSLVPSIFCSGAKQEAEAARRFLAKALDRQNHPTPRVIHTDGHGAYPPAIAQLKTEGVLDENCRHRVGRYLNNVVEQDTAPSSGGSKPASISVPFGRLGEASLATKRST